MKRIFAIASIAFLFSCKNSNHDLSGNEPLKPEGFLKHFKELTLPLSIADTGLQRFGDTSTFSNAVFTQFVPDSVLQIVPDKQAGKYAIHPAGIIHGSKEEDYLLTKFSYGKNFMLFVFVFDGKHKYVSSLQVLNNFDNDKFKHSVSITSEPTFIIKKEKIGKNNELLYSRNGYAFSAATNSFTEVMNDSNEDTKKLNEIINPIDSFPSTNKFSGDYLTDKKNFISVRDGKNAITYNFFIHFEKDDGGCTGELKGEMTLTDQNNTVYQESGDPCVIRFKFSGNTVKVKEEGNCGNHRGITCPFDFSFKKKNIKTLKTK